MPVRFDGIRRSIGIKVIAVDMLEFVKIRQEVLLGVYNSLCKSQIR